MTVLHGLRGDLTDRRARLAAALVDVADSVGTAVLAPHRSAYRVGTLVAERRQRVGGHA